MTRVAFLSDIHLGGHNTLGPDKALYRKGIAQVIRYLRTQQITHMVLLGDILDNWTFPRDTVPLTYQQMLDHPDNAEIVSALKEVAADPNISLVYCQGNHDFDLPDDLFCTYFPTTQMGDHFTLGLVWGEHGHRFDLFNAPDPQNLDPAGGHRPLGYYITRIHTRLERSGAGAGLNSSTYIHNVVERASHELTASEYNTKGPSKWTVATIVLDYVVKDAGASYNDTILMPDGQTVTIQQVSDAYRDIYKTWQDKEGLGWALNSILAAVEQLDISAQKVRNDHAKRLVVFGHSHVAKWNPYTVQVAGKGVTGAYVNDGAMCKWPQTAVIVDYLPTTFKVTRLSWDSKGEMSVENEEISNTWKSR